MKKPNFDITLCSLEELEVIFKPLNQYRHIVFWIRDREMTKQIFCSQQYDQIWGRDRSLLYEMPMLWLDYLDKEELSSRHMKDLQLRHDKNYENRNDNIALYKILNGNNEKQFIYCQAIKCKSGLGRYFIIGLSAEIPKEEWVNACETKQLINDEEFKKAENLFLSILKTHFNFNEVINKIDVPNWNALQELIERHEKVALTPREIECLYYFCHGKTAKMTAKLMNLSFRTIEEYLENIKVKSKLDSKIKVVSKFSVYFRDSG